MHVGLGDVAMDLANGQVQQDYYSFWCRHRDWLFEAVNQVRKARSELEYSMQKDLHGILLHRLLLRLDYPVVTAAFAPSSNRCLGLNRPNLNQLCIQN